MAAIITMTGGTAGSVTFNGPISASRERSGSYSSNLPDNFPCKNAEHEAKRQARALNRVLGLIAQEDLSILVHPRYPNAPQRTPVLERRTPTRRRTATATRNFRRAH